MPPNPRVVKAFRAMMALGIAEDTVKPVLKALLRVYEKNWNLIEEENYRVLADAIFDYEENKKLEHKKDLENSNDNNMLEDVRQPDEPRKTFKRLRLKYQDQAGSSSERVQGDSGGCSSKRPKIDSSHLQLDPEAVYSSGLSVCSLRSESLVNSASARSGPKEKQHALSQSLVARESSYLKEPKPEPGLDVSPQKEVHNSVMLIKPKDEPVTDYANNFLHPVAVIPPGDSFTLNGSAEKTNGLQSRESLSGNVEIREDSIRASSDGRTDQEPAFVSQAHCESVDISSSSIGGIQISLKCKYIGRPGFHAPSFDCVLELVDNKYRNAYNFDNSFSAAKLMEDICKSCLELGSKSAADPQKQDSQRDLTEEQVTFTGNVNKETAHAIASTELANVEVIGAEIHMDPVPPVSPSDLILPDGNCVVNGDGNEFLDGQDHSCTVTCDSPLKVPSDLVHSDQNGIEDRGIENEKINVQDHNVVTPEILAEGEPTDTCAGCAKPKFYVEDITKGQEMVKISLVNEVDTSPPPSFFYIPRNLIFQNAYVNVSLARIGNEDCCSDCSSDCLSSKVPCVCAQETGGEFAYTSDGLVKESILEECISMNRDPKKHCQFFCKDNDCPLERSKSGDMVEPCKGHLVRQFIKECWSKCGCHKQCGNRQVQRGITCKLQVFMTQKGKGWGLRTLEDLPKGAFVCEYVGEIMTNSELYERNMKSTLKHAYPVLLDADWGSEKVLKDEEALCLDATIFGNVARFINHRCFDANMVEIPVQVETPDRHYYHLAFFTTRDVAAMEELTWDYGIDFDDQEHPVKAFSCSCGSKFCRNIKRTRRRRIRC